MEPKKVGRALGIGVRVASKMVRERVAEAAASPAPAGIPQATVPPPNSRPAPQTPETRTRAPQEPRLAKRIETTKRGVHAFGQAFLAPFTHAGSILWLEITGLFFALFTLFFAQNVYRIHADWKGAEHTHVLLYSGLAVAFAWFSLSSFMRAYRKNKQGPGGNKPRR